jgi:hypothetical protein
MILSVAACSVQSRQALSNESALFRLPLWTKVRDDIEVRTRKPERTAIGPQTMRRTLRGWQA